MDWTDSCWSSNQSNNVWSKMESWYVPLGHVHILIFFSNFYNGFIFFIADNQEMKFGGLVSSSNTYSNDPVIKIKADQPLIWSMGVSL